MIAAALGGLMGETTQPCPQPARAAAPRVRPIVVTSVDESTCDAVVEALEGAYRVEPVATAEDAVAWARSGGARALVVGVSAENDPGFGACERIAASTERGVCPLVVVLRDGAEDLRLMAYACGADDVVLASSDRAQWVERVGMQARLSDAHEELSRLRVSATSDSRVLAQRVDRAERQVHDTRDLLVFALARLAESRDPETGAHLERIREYCRILAQELVRIGAYAGQIDAGFVDDLYRASPLHDIGKVGVPDAILLKPGKLSRAEFAVMQTHCAIGADALQEVADRGHAGEFLRMAVQIARHHHERWDGGGYPDGLAGEATPLAARIASVADVYDALTTARVYKPAFPEQHARELILGGAGAQFDPLVVEAFDTAYPSMLATLRELGDAGPGLEAAA
ncbi:MAG: HD domain-containing phosphohydrolase [Planctomycetota bacterium]